LITEASVLITAYDHLLSAYVDPVIRHKAFNIIETLKADRSLMAGLLISGWNPLVDWMVELRNLGSWFSYR
jgi:hypothetical protein